MRRRWIISLLIYYSESVDALKSYNYRVTFASIPDAIRKMDLLKYISEIIKTKKHLCRDEKERGLKVKTSRSISHSRHAPPVKTVVKRSRIAGLPSLKSYIQRARQVAQRMHPIRWFNFSLLVEFLQRARHSPPAFALLSWGTYASVRCRFAFDVLRSRNKFVSKGRVRPHLDGSLRKCRLHVSRRFSSKKFFCG